MEREQAQVYSPMSSVSIYFYFLILQNSPMYHVLVLFYSQSPALSHSGDCSGFLFQTSHTLPCWFVDPIFIPNLPHSPMWYGYSLLYSQSPTLSPMRYMPIILDSQCLAILHSVRMHWVSFHVSNPVEAMYISASLALSHAKHAHQVIFPNVLPFSIP